MGESYTKVPLPKKEELISEPTEAIGVGVAELTGTHSTG